MDPSEQHNYLTKLYAMWESGELPREAGYHQLTIKHDGWCGVFQDKRCNCDPDIRLRARVPGNMNYSKGGLWSRARSQTTPRMAVWNVRPNGRIPSSSSPMAIPAGVVGSVARFSTLFRGSMATLRGQEHLRFPHECFRLADPHG
jgi:hypothetical protein